MLKRFSSIAAHIIIILVAAVASDQARHSHGTKEHKHHIRHLSELLERSSYENDTCAKSASRNITTYWLDEQIHTGLAGGYSPFLQDHATYPIYRNAKSYGAAGNGNTDDTQSLQNAINDDGKGGSRYQGEITTRPAEVFLPGGRTYKLNRQLDLRLNTILVGDPNNRPILKASTSFSGDTVVNGFDFASHAAGGTTTFFVAVKNIIIDTTNVDRNSKLVALQWGVAQGCQLSNIDIRMPTNSGGHVGIALDQGSTTAVTDVVRSTFDCVHGDYR